jgi:hypothetical protein
MAGKNIGIIYKYYNQKKIYLWKKYFIFNGKKEGEYKNIMEMDKKQKYVIIKITTNKENIKNIGKIDN